MPSSNAASPEPAAALAESSVTLAEPIVTLSEPTVTPIAPATPAAAATCAWAACSSEFASVHQLAIHLSAEHVMVPDASPVRACAWRGCSMQGVTMSSHRELVAHLRIHTGNRSFLCPVDGCAKVYKRSDFLAKHISSHADTDTAASSKHITHADTDTAASAKRKSQPSADDSDTDSESTGFSDEHVPHSASAFNAGVPDSDIHAGMLEAQLAYIRDQVASRQTRLRSYRTKIRRLRLENDILVDALAQI
ncbi:Zinc finger protein ZIC 2 [Coemansia sp. RSA 2523]|nr:Zinc finger protein ZIC 2 [Coemansia sp. RSA 2167]KAJ1807172.1 Zinc finger protein ZIC 2 [Coemansia sp. RSA 2523]KAJ2150153.1 Zinc finger protein ZIC 2 [Coemansia sp. RSA 637]KAJ2248472.1 Zinc finger protein ZIC 2 [Coemansia sp. RSA 475]KAJ2267622.1 Zinc finger protein ZIC 2 [Coemansia sp. RSA 451]KAJ2273599.1 Zinc finger protein ZIC 2 [Coemansia sp. RSA 370]KAJ2285732.1 Zinc finger protein ZIC 2 [Coemansia sp. RSA 355]KAJ2427636.1 Zinc finger protein ZIC 2 [Coemansia sp. RSA 2524]KAJ258